MKKPPATVRGVARPVRIAYVIEDGAGAHACLNTVFSDCLGRDAGRQSLVVPLVEGAILRRYLDWMRLLDPDYVVLATFDNAGIAKSVMRSLGGTRFIAVERDGNLPARPTHFGDRVPEALSSLSWLPFMRARAGTFHRMPAYILDAYPAWNDDGFITDNFGTLVASLSQFPVHRELQEFVRPALLTPSDAPKDRWRYGVTDCLELSTPYDVLRTMRREEGGLLTLGLLSNLNSNRYHVTHTWRDSFCLFVGDDFHDRICAWNAALLYEDAQSQPYKSLRVPANAAGLPGVIEAIAEYLARANWIGQQNGPSRVTLRSFTLPAQALEPLAVQLRELSRCSVQYAVVNAIDECCPDIEKVHALGVGRVTRSISEVTIDSERTTIPVPTPKHLSYGLNANPIFQRGGWFVDLEIDRLSDNNRFSNLRDVWRLPARAEVARLFVPNHNPTRIPRDATVGVYVTIQQETLAVEQPDDQVFFSYLLHSPTLPAAGDPRGQTPQPPEFQDSTTSDKGRYLNGAIGMFGSLERAAQFLGSHFWRSQFVQMAGPVGKQYPETVTKLKRRLGAVGGKAIAIADDADWERLADVVARMSIGFRVPRYVTRVARLVEARSQELREAVKIFANEAHRLDEFLAEAPAEIERALRYLCNAGVYYRGHQWSCERCSHTNWVSLGSFRDSVICEVCKKSHQLPMNLTLDLRLNEFLATCVREHDTVTLVWGLAALRNEARRCFIYSPQLSLYRKYREEQENEPDQEVDVLCVVDGRLIVGEAKARVEQISADKITVLARVADHLRADVAILMALDGRAALMEEKVDHLRAQLPNFIEPRGLVSDWVDQPSLNII